MSYSVVTIGYKSLDNVKRAVDQASNSSLPPDEIIVIVNPYVYNDQTGPIIDYVCSPRKDSRITGWALISQNMGCAKGFNLGMSLSKSDYVVLLNDDCSVGPTTYEKMIKEFEKQDVGVVGVEAGGRPEYDPITAKGFLLAYRKKMIEEIGGYDEIASPLACENELGYRAWANGWSTVIAPGCDWFHIHDISNNVKDRINYLGEEMSPEGENPLIPKILPVLKQKWAKHNEVIQNNVIS